MWSNSKLKDRVWLITVLDEMAARGKTRERLEFERRLRYDGQMVIPSFYRRWVDNLFDEPRLTRSTWARLIRRVRRLPSDAGPTEVFDSCVQVFRRCLRSASPSGPEAEIPQHRCLGRVVPRPVLEGHLMSRARETDDRTPGLGGSSMAAEAFVTALIRGDTIDIPPPLREIRLHEYLMWATFSDEYHPFSGILEDRNHLRCVLGLLGRDCELVLLVYGLPQDCTAHVPTVTEAYAGGSWGVLFQPAHPGARFGHTIPRPECGEDLTRPEVVHRPITLRDLSARLQTL